MFFMSLADSDLQEFFVSYDIACQWHKNIWDRMQIYPREIRRKNESRYFVFLVPKFHLPCAHRILQRQILIPAHPLRWPDRWQSTGAWMVEYQSTRNGHEGNGAQFAMRGAGRPF
jgi:hypothetical protein